MKNAARKRREDDPKVWPVGRPIPSFTSYKEEAEWWDSHDLSALFEAQGLDAPSLDEYEPPPRHLSVRVDDATLSRAKAEARRRGTSVAEVVRSKLRELPAVRRKRAPKRGKKHRT